MQKEILKTKGIQKKFPGILAVDNIDFELFAGEIHGIVGENGAGKSTFVRMLDGSLKPDKGEIIINKQNITLNSPRDAMLQGISMIPQELDLLPHLSVAENIMFYKLSEGYKKVEWKELKEVTSQKLKEFGVQIFPKQKVNELNIAQQQIVAIIKALVMNTKIIIFDEPTSALSHQDIARFFSILKRIKSKGVGIIFISHRLNEIFEITDRVTIFRDGHNLGTYKHGSLTEKRLSELIAGRSIRNQYPKKKIIKGKEVLRINNLTVKEKIDNVSFILNEGEVLGIAGALGAGKTEIALSIFGSMPISDNTEIFLKGEKISLSSPAIAISKGLALVPEDRHRMGLIINQSIRFNISLPNLINLSRSGFVISELEKEISNKAVGDLGIKCQSIEQNVKYLSGGNQQKVVIAKGLIADSKVIILDEPTRGIDVGAKLEIYKLINELKINNIGILLLSSDIHELCGVADRIIVLVQGKFAKEFSGDETNEKEIQQLILSGRSN